MGSSAYRILSSTVLQRMLCQLLRRKNLLTSVLGTTVSVFDGLARLRILQSRGSFLCNTATHGTPSEVARSICSDSDGFSA
mmetsp:Transcript_50101/g.83161  ORF Transcript_50101/g.83161 Transcript_50101/m.83161 type:complete len:81 (-) Transcript_50101:1073-1315(-)